MPQGAATFIDLRLQTSHPGGIQNTEFRIQKKDDLPTAHSSILNSVFPVITTHAGYIRGRQLRSCFEVDSVRKR